MSDTQSDPILATLQASGPRRFTGALMLALLGVLVIYLAFSVAFGIAQITLVVIGVVALFAAQRLYSKTAQVLELTATELRVRDGVTLAEIAKIRKLERGAFAFKPSNGFLILLNESQPRRWVPGMYWCVGQKLGIGGVTGAAQTKALAEEIGVLLALREQRGG